MAAMEQEPGVGASGVPSDARAARDGSPSPELSKSGYASARGQPRPGGAFGPTTGADAPSSAKLIGRLARSSAPDRKAGLDYLSTSIGNRRVAKLIADAREPAPRAEQSLARAPGPGGDVTPAVHVIPRVKIERDATVRTRLVMRYQGEVIGTLDVRGAEASVDSVLIRDRTQIHPGTITRLDIEVLHPPDATVKFELRRGSFAKVGKPHGLVGVDVKPIAARPPYPRDELQLWPPVESLGPIRRPETRRRNEPSARSVAAGSLGSCRSCRSCRRRSRG